jgi:general secretion pathway protein D
MMKKQLALILAVLICLAPGYGTLGNATASSFVENNQASSQKWKNLLKDIGVDPVGNEQLVRKLGELPAIAQRMQNSTTQPMYYSNWVKTLQGMGIEPKPNMSQADWTLLLTAAGVTVVQDPASPEPVAPQPTATPASAPILPATSQQPSGSLTPPMVVQPTPPINPTSSSPNAPNASGTVQGEWEDVLTQIGVEKGKNLQPADYDLLIQKLTTLPRTAKKIQESAGRGFSLMDWVKLLTGIGIVPKSNMKDSEWSLILAKAGISATGGLVQPILSRPAQPAGSGQSSANGNYRPISLELRGMDVMEVLKLLSRQSGLSIIASPNVRGSVSIFLKDVDVWQALRLVLETNDLAYVQDNGVVRVMTESDYEKVYGIRFDDKTGTDIYKFRYIKAVPASRFLEPVKSRVGRIVVYDSANSVILFDTPEAISKMKKLAQEIDVPQEMKVFTINYAKGEDIVSRLATAATKDIGDIQYDKRTNRIMVTDTPNKMRQIENIISTFDERHRTVLIEAKIVQISLNKKFQMGVNWEHVFSKINGEFVPGDIKGTFNILPIGGLGLAANIGDLSRNNYTALIQLLETAGKTNLLSSPRITALNNESAHILVGTKEAYVTTTVTTPGGGTPATTAEQVNFIDVGVKLYVTPSIGEDGYISLKIRPEVSSVDRVLTTSQGNSIPILRTSEAETSIVAKDGETILIGGLIEDHHEKSDSRIPWLGQIPILGFPFRGRTDTNGKTEIAVFLTPTILTGDKAAPAAEKTPGPLPMKKG